jgi:hypothetical protein
MSLASSVLFNTRPKHRSWVRGNASDGEGRVVKAAQPVLCNHNNWQLHCRGQIADVI